MIRFEKSLKAWPGEAFNAALKSEIEAMDPELLPLQQALTQSSHVQPGRVGVTILAVSGDSDVISARAGIFFVGIIAGCSCADDPTPMNEINEYCEVLFRIDKRTARVVVALLVDDR